MKVANLGANGVGSGQASGIIDELSKKAGRSGAGVKFGEVFERISNQGRSLSDVLGTNFQSDFAKLEKTIRAGQSIPAQELLLWQFKVGQVNLRVELVSKVAESALASVRKFQNGQ